MCVYIYIYIYIYADKYNTRNEVDTDKHDMYKTETYVECQYEYVSRYEGENH